MLWWNLRKLRVGDSSQSSDAIVWLAGHKSAKATERLKALLKDERASVRERAARALSWCDDQTAIEPLVESLNDKFPDVRVSCARALGELRGARAFQALEAKLRAGDAEVNVVRALVEALIKFGEAAAPSVGVAVSDEREEVREAVAIAIRYSQNPAAFVDALEILLADPNENVRYHAGQALARVADSPAAGESVVSPLAIVIRAVTPGKDIPDGVFESKFIRERITELLDKIPTSWWETAGARNMAPMLIEKARDRDSTRVRVAAVESMRRLKDPSTRETLAAFLYGDINQQCANDTDLAGGFDIAKEALDAIDSGWQQAARKELIELIENLVALDPGKRGHANAAMCAIDSEWHKRDYAVDALPSMLLALRSNDKYRRLAAARWLGMIGHPESLNWLLDSTDDPDAEVRRKVREALATYMPEHEIDDHTGARKTESAAATATEAPMRSSETSENRISQNGLVPVPGQKGHCQMCGRNEIPFQVMAGRAFFLCSKNCENTYGHLRAQALQLSQVSHSIDTTGMGMDEYMRSMRQKAFDTNSFCWYCGKTKKVGDDRCLRCGAQADVELK